MNASLPSSPEPHQLFFTITPFDPTKPCPFSKLPAELRVEIYCYALSWYSEGIPLMVDVTNTLKKKISVRPGIFIPPAWPALLWVCRSIRHEAAYEFYTRQYFAGFVFDNDFRPVMRWFDLLPPSFKSYSARNSNFTIYFTTWNWERCGPDATRWTQFPGNLDYLRKLVMDPSRADELWSQCPRFAHLRPDDWDDGNPNVEVQLVLVSRMIDWFLWCGQDTEHAAINWGYQARLDVIRSEDVKEGYGHRLRSRYDQRYSLFKTLCEETLGYLWMVTPERVPLSREEQKRMSKEARNLLHWLELEQVRLGIVMTQRLGKRLAFIKAQLDQWKRINEAKNDNGGMGGR